MAEAETASDEDTEREQIPWAKQQPTSRIRVSPNDLFFTGDFGSDNRQTGMDFGLAVSSLDVVTGTLFENDAREDGIAASESGVRGTDYRIIDPDDKTANIVKGALTTGEQEAPNVYEETDTVTDDEVVIFYDGLSGERLARVLDFNGQPFARWTGRDGEPYLVKGLIQVHEDWRGASSAERRDMRAEDNGPRVARLPLLRDDVDDILIDLSRYEGGNAYEIHVFDADEFEDEFGSLDHPLDEIDRDEYGGLEAESEITMQFNGDADEIIADTWADDVDEDIEGPEDAGYFMTLFNDDGGWGNKPDSVGGDFDGISTDSGTGGDRVAQFVDTIVDAMEADESAHGATPSIAFESRGGIEGMIDEYEDQFTERPDADEVREAVYERIAWLDVEELE